MLLKSFSLYFLWIYRSRHSYPHLPKEALRKQLKIVSGIASGSVNRSGREAALESACSAASGSTEPASDPKDIPTWPGVKFVFSEEIRKIPGAVGANFLHDT